MVEKRNRCYVNTGDLLHYVHLYQYKKKKHGDWYFYFNINTLDDYFPQTVKKSPDGLLCIDYTEMILVMFFWFRRLYSQGILKDY